MSGKRGKQGFHRKQHTEGTWRKEISGKGKRVRPGKKGDGVRGRAGGGRAQTVPNSPLSLVLSTRKNYNLCLKMNGLLVPPFLVLTN